MYSDTEISYCPSAYYSSQYGLVGWFAIIIQMLNCIIYITNPKKAMY